MATAAAASSSSAAPSTSPVHLPSDFRTLPTPAAFIPPGPPALAYTQSSQFQNWRFTRAQLRALRGGANAGARRRCVEGYVAGGKGKGRAREEVEAEAGTLPFPTPADELELIHFYLGKVPALTRALGLPEFVGAGAMSYIKRFYLRNSCLEWHPKHIMLTCLFLATKTENVPMSLTVFASKVAGGGGGGGNSKAPAPAASVVEESARSIREHEFLVSQSLGFEFMLWGAGRALQGLLSDIQLLDPPLSNATYHELAQAAQEPLAFARLSDAEFIYTPAQIALTCLRAAEARVLAKPAATENGASSSSWGVGELGQVTRPFVMGKEAKARMEAAKARKQRDALREQDAERLRRHRGGPDPKGDGDGDDDDAADRRPLGPTTKIANPALALSHKNGTLLGVLDECAALLEAEAERRRGGAAGAAERMERVKAVDRNIKACKIPASASTSAAGSRDGERDPPEGQPAAKRARVDEPAQG